MEATPIRTYRDVVHGQEVDVKVYATPPPPPTYSSWVKRTSGREQAMFSIDETFYCEPRTTKYEPVKVNLADVEA